MIRAALLTLLAWIAVHGSAFGQASSVELKAPRAFGYLAGDILQIEAVIATAPDARLSAASLPRPRPIRPWLDLRAVSVDEEKADTGGRRYRLRLDYQLLDAPMDAAERTVPPLTVKVEGPGGLADAVIPAWTLRMSPLRGALPSATGTSDVLMPDAAPTPAAAAQHVLSMTAAGLGALISLMLLAHYRAWWPFQHRGARPFTLAWRDIRDRISAMRDEAGYRDSLLALHRAFDEAAGRRVFASDMEAFLDTHPHFRSARHDIGQFFLASRRAFFADDIAGASEQHPIEAIFALSHRLSTLERQGG